MNRMPVDDSGASRGSIRSYTVGFILAIVLTVSAFELVGSRALSDSATLFAIFGAAIVQMLVHLHYFLHMDASSAARWNALALLFTVLIMAIFIGGTIWIMVNLHHRMM